VSTGGADLEGSLILQYIEILKKVGTPFKRTGGSNAFAKRGYRKDLNLERGSSDEPRDW